VRDLFNEEEQPGVSQGKLYLVLDMLDEAASPPPPLTPLNPSHITTHTACGHRFADI
jgi:hypothetical protein